MNKRRDMYIKFLNIHQMAGRNRNLLCVDAEKVISEDSGERSNRADPGR